MENYDLVVIGARSGGYPAALRAAQQGAKLALVEKELTWTVHAVAFFPRKHK